MLVNILQTFDFAGRRYLVGDNPDADPALARKWIADGFATADIDQRQDNAVDPAALAASGFKFVGVGCQPSAKTISAIQAAHDAVSAMTFGGYVELEPGAVYVQDTPTTRLSWNAAKVGLKCNGAKLDFTSMMTGAAITVDYIWPGAGGVNLSVGKIHHFDTLCIVGPGGTVTGTTGFKTAGTQATPFSAGVRCLLFNPYIAGFETLYEQGTRSYLQTLYNPEFYDGAVMIKQTQATDSGENCQIFGGVSHSVDLGFWLLDDSSEWTANGMSFDYMHQMLVGQVSQIALTLNDCHIEVRGSELGADPGNYIIQGTGYDSRAHAAGFDTFFDIGGDGSHFEMNGGVIGISNSGGNGPYSVRQYVNVRHANSRALFNQVKFDNLANTSECFWTGPGICRVIDPHTKATPLLMSRLTDQTRYTALQDSVAQNGGFMDLWAITKDTISVFGGPIDLTVGGTSDALTASAPNGITTILQGMAFTFTPTADNTTTTPNITIGVQSAITFTNIAGSAVAAGSLKAGIKTQAVYDGTTLRIMDHQRTIGRNGIFQRSTAVGGRLTGFTSLVGGSGYGAAPTVAFSGGGATTQATGHTVINAAGQVVDIIIDTEGVGYTSAPTATFTPVSGGSGASATMVVSNTGSFKITKATSGAFRIAHFHPVVPGEQVSVYMKTLLPSAGAMTVGGGLFVELRFCKVTHMDPLGRPWVTVQDNTTSSGAISSTTGAWQTYKQARYLSGATGAVAAPAWATHAMIVLNLDNGGAGDLYIDDVAISRWA